MQQEVLLLFQSSTHCFEQTPTELGVCFKLYQKDVKVQGIKEQGGMVKQWQICRVSARRSQSHKKKYFHFYHEILKIGSSKKKKKSILNNNNGFKIDLIGQLLRQKIQATSFQKIAFFFYHVLTVRSNLWGVRRRRFSALYQASDSKQRLGQKLDLLWWHILGTWLGVSSDFGSPIQCSLDGKTEVSSNKKMDTKVEHRESTGT